MEKVRLLVVDNDQPIANLAATAARYEGDEAVTANSGYLSNVVEQAISRLRRKLDGDYGDTEGNGKDEPQLIHTAQGVGYVVWQVSE